MSKSTKRARFLYHITPKENVPKIIQEGLRKSAGNRTTFAVYLSTKPFSWYTEGMRILKVDISGLSCTPATTFLPESDEVLFWGDIPPWKHTKKGCVPRITDVTEKFVRSKEGEG